MIGALDRYTCAFCGAMDSKIFKMSEYLEGSTAPPFHPWCRCCTAPYFADMEGLGERYARDIETGKAYKVPGNTIYEQWKQMQDAKYGAGSVDKARKMQYNVSADKEQYDRYKKVLGDLVPNSFEEFQTLKYSPDGLQSWEELKHKYRIVNQYKIDSGSLTGREIYELDNRVITEKRQLFSSDYKKNGNIAGAYLDGDNTKLYLSHSRINNPKGTAKYHGEAQIVSLSEHKRFDYIDVVGVNGFVDNNTRVHTEAKLFEYFATLYQEQPFKSVTILSERGMCDSCLNVMKQFKALFPEVKINAVSNKRVLGDVWYYRRRNK